MQRYPVVAVVPLTRTAGKALLYPCIPAGHGSLRADSYAMADQVRAVDRKRILGEIGVIPDEDLRLVETALVAFFGLGRHILVAPESDDGQTSLD